jgi:MFS family permease
MGESNPAERPADQAAARAALPRNVRLLGLASLVNDIAGEMIFPLIPRFLIRELGGGTASLGAVEGVADTTASIVKLWSGSLSDRAGKRKIFVVTGYALAAVSRPLVALATAPWQVLVVRSTDRFGKGIRAAPRDAMIADSTTEGTRGRAFGFTRAMDHLGAAIGPLVAFAFLWLWPGQLRTLFLASAVPGLAVVLWVLFGLRDRPASTHAAQEFESLPTKPALEDDSVLFREVLSERSKFTLAPFDRNFLVYLVALVVFTLGNSSDSFLLVRVGELGVSEATLPLLWCAFHVVKSAGSILAGRAVDRFGARPLIYAGWIIYAAIYLAFSLATSALQGWFFFLCYGLFYALTEPAERTLVVSLVQDARTGLAFGWFNLAIGIAALPANLIFGVLYQEFGGQVAFTWSAALAVMAVALLSLVRRRGEV